MPNHYLTLAPIPPSYRNPAFPPPATTHALKPFVKPNPPPPLPFVKQDSTLPTVYFTLGTVFNLESGDLFSRVLTALQTVAVNAVVTVGTHIDPSTFGVQPPHIHITQYLPQLSVLPHCDMVISHGGSGTVIASLAHGLPLLIIPMGADQPHNAERCQALGVGRMLDPLTATTDKISEALFSLLGESRYRMAAQRLAQEIETLPDPAYVVELLERLHNDKQPVINR
jgi:MGT family glycosyltransferase